LKGYGRLFVCYQTDNIKKCGHFLSGLLHHCKSNIERIVECVFGSDYDQMHHFISVSGWDSKAVMDEVAQKTYQTLCDRGTGQGLILDESGWEKSGTKSVGVARQYIGQVGKVANGQVCVFASLSNGDQVGLIQSRLYLPQEWVDDTERCAKAGIPESERVYRTKPELAVKIIETLPQSVQYDWVGGDSIYGNSYTLRQHLYTQKQAFVLDVGEDLGVYLQCPTLYIPEKKSGRGREPSKYVCDDKPLSIKHLAHQISDDQWTTLTHRSGTKGPMIRRAVIMDVYIWKAERETTIESVQLIISTNEDGGEIKYSLCYTPNGKMDLETALYRQMQRYWVERAFQNAKEHLGLHQYQVRSWKALHHHLALTMMALHFILELQNEAKVEMPLISVADIKLVFAKKLRNKLNSDLGIIGALTLRHKKRSDDIMRKNRVPK
jgi:SRSO17 transposase